jgi:hypothetical protein
MRTHRALLSNALPAEQGSSFLPAADTARVFRKLKQHPANKVPASPLCAPPPSPHRATPTRVSGTRANARVSVARSSRGRIARYDAAPPLFCCGGRKMTMRCGRVCDHVRAALTVPAAHAGLLRLRAQESQLDKVRTRHIRSHRRHRSCALRACLRASRAHQLRPHMACSIPFGIHLCLDCSAVHRRMGTHITFVKCVPRAGRCAASSAPTTVLVRNPPQHRPCRSSVLDKWTQEHLLVCEPPRHHRAPSCGRGSAFRSFGRALAAECALLCCTVHGGGRQPERGRLLQAARYGCSASTGRRHRRDRRLCAGWTDKGDGDRKEKYTSRAAQLYRAHLQKEARYAVSQHSERPSWPQPCVRTVAYLMLTLRFVRWAWRKPGRVARC